MPPIKSQYSKINAANRKPRQKCGNLGALAVGEIRILLGLQAEGFLTSKKGPFEMFKPNGVAKTKIHMCKDVSGIIRLYEEMSLEKYPTTPADKNGALDWLIDIYRHDSTLARKNIHIQRDLAIEGFVQTSLEKNKKLAKIYENTKSISEFRKELMLSPKCKIGKTKLSMSHFIDQHGDLRTTKDEIVVALHHIGNSISIGVILGSVAATLLASVVAIGGANSIRMKMQGPNAYSMV